MKKFMTFLFISLSAASAFANGGSGDVGNAGTIAPKVDQFITLVSRQQADSVGDFNGFTGSFSTLPVFEPGQLEKERLQISSVAAPRKYDVYYIVDLALANSSSFAYDKLRIVFHSLRQATSFHQKILNTDISNTFFINYNNHFGYLKDGQWSSVVIKGRAVYATEDAAVYASHNGKLIAINEMPAKLSDIKNEVIEGYQRDIHCGDTQDSYDETDLSAEFKATFASTIATAKAHGFQYSTTGRNCNQGSWDGNKGYEVQILTKKSQRVLRDNFGTLGIVRARVQLNAQSEQQLNEGIVLVGQKDNLVSADGQATGQLSTSRVVEGQDVLILVRKEKP